MKIKQPELAARNAVVINAATGETVFEKNKTETVSNASTTKIMTCILALEILEPNEKTLEVIEDDVVRGSKMGLDIGESMTVSEMLYGLMMTSGNEAANVIARTVSTRLSGKGTYDDFVSLMNEKAKNLGMADTSFKNASGLDEPGHYSTAIDMTVLTRYAMQNDAFRRIVSTKEYVISSECFGEEKKYLLANTNRLLWTYDGCTGVKTGTTYMAGACLAASAEDDNGTELIAIILGSTIEERYKDAEKLLDYGLKVHNIV